MSISYLSNNMLAAITGDQGKNDNKVQDSSVKYGRNAAANFKQYIEDFKFPELTKDTFDFQKNPVEDTQKLLDQMNSPDHKKALNNPIAFRYKYLPGAVDANNLDKKALLGVSFEELGQKLSAPVQEMTQKLQEAFGANMSAASIDINKDNNIDIGEYATAVLVSDMLSTDSTRLEKKNITGEINNQGQNRLSAYFNKNNEQGAESEFKAVYDDFNLGTAAQEFASNPNNLSV